MTFNEWVGLTSQNTKPHYNKAVVKAVLLAAVKTAVDELVCNKEYSELALMGIGKFYCSYISYKSRHFCPEGKGCNIWTLRFRPSRKLLDIVNDRCEDMNSSSILKMYNDSVKEYESLSKKELEIINSIHDRVKSLKVPARQFQKVYGIPYIDYNYWHNNLKYDKLLKFNQTFC